MKAKHITISVLILLVLTLSVFADIPVKLYGELQDDGELKLFMAHDIETQPIIELKDDCTKGCKLHLDSETKHAIKSTVTSTKYRPMNNPPVLTKKIPSHDETTLTKLAEVSAVWKINLSEYFYDPDNDKLTYGAMKNSSVSVVIADNIAMVKPRRNDIIKVTFSARDEDYEVESNEVVFDARRYVKKEMHAIIDDKSAKQLTAEIGKPVVWVEEVTIANDDSLKEMNIEIDVPIEATNISVIDTEYNLKLQEVVVKGKDLDHKSFVSRLDENDEIVQKRISPNIEVNSHTTLPDEFKNKTIEFEELIEKDEVKTFNITFETAAPQKTESVLIQEDNSLKKDVTISSNASIHYYNITSYTNITPALPEDVSLFWKIDGKKVDVTFDRRFNVEFHDENEDGLVEKLSWITPRLSVQEFEVVITLSTSSGTGLAITPISPQGQHFQNGDDIDFRFLVVYNKSLILWCNLTIDGDVKDSITVSDGEEVVLNNDYDLEDGPHSWSAVCSDSSSNSAVSTPQEFTIDVNEPTIELNNQNPDLSLTGDLNLSFTPRDDLSNALQCDLLINGAVHESDIYVGNNSELMIELSSVANGTYTWEVECEDEAQNVGTSDTYTFNIDTEREFSITTNKPEYELGEDAVYVIEAPFNSNVTVVITTPEPSTIIRDYSTNFPVLGTIDDTSLPGTYTIEGYLNYQGALQTKTTSFEVLNNLGLSIDANTTHTTTSSTIGFKANGAGGIGNLSYSWDFGDETGTVSGIEVTHSYAELGNYAVTLTARDEEGNEIVATKSIKIDERYTALITVVDKKTNKPIEDAQVFIDQVEKRTDESGNIDFGLFEGRYLLSVTAIDYKPYSTSQFYVVGETEKTVELIPFNTTTNITEIIVNETSEIIEETTEVVEIIDEAEIIEVVDSSLLSKIEAALGSINDMETQDKDLAKTILFRKNLEDAERFFKGVNRDLYNLEENRRGLSEKEIEEEKKKIDEQIESYEKTLIISIENTESSEFIKPALTDAIRELTKEYLNAHNISVTDNEENNHIKFYKDLQAALSVSTKASKATVTYLSGTEESIVILEHSIEANEDIEKRPYVVLIPKEITKTADNIKSITPMTILRDDPVLSFDISDSKKVIYLINEDISLEKAKEITGMLMGEYSEIKKKKGFTGFAVFSKLTDIDNPLIILEILAIIILLGVYATYQFDVISIVKEKLHHDKELDPIKGCIEDMRTCIVHNEMGNASVVYNDVMKEYTKLPKEKKGMVHEEVTAVYNEMIMTQLTQAIDAIEEHISKEDLQNANLHYENVMKLYKALAKKYKAKITDRCHEVFDKLAKYHMK